jgi:hypothetical protein
LVGSWRLQSIQFEFADTGERIDLYGTDPSGHLILTSEGRLMVIVTRSDRKALDEDTDGAALFKTMMAYTGVYRVEDDEKFVTDVDVAWRPAWVGDQQARYFKFDGDTLSLATGELPAASPGRTGRAIMAWTRA